MIDAKIIFKFNNAEYISPTFKTNLEKIDWFYDEYVGGADEDSDLFWETDIYGSGNNLAQDITVDFLGSIFNKNEASRLAKVFAVAFDEAPIDDFNNWVKNNMSIDNSERAKKVSDLVYEICLEASKRIDDGIAIGKPLHITKLSKELSEKFSIKNQVEMYHILRLFVSLQPDIKAVQGPNGGIVKIKVQPV